MVSTYVHIYIYYVYIYLSLYCCFIIETSIKLTGKALGHMQYTLYNITRTIMSISSTAITRHSLDIKLLGEKGYIKSCNINSKCNI